MAFHVNIYSSPSFKKPANTIGNFTCELNSTINLDCDYEVAVCAINDYTADNGDLNISTAVQGAQFFPEEFHIESSHPTLNAIDSAILKTAHDTLDNVRDPIIIETYTHLGAVITYKDKTYNMHFFWFECSTKTCNPKIYSCECSR